MLSHRVVPDSLHASQRTALSFATAARSYLNMLRNTPFMVYMMAGTLLLLGAFFAYISVSPFVLMTEFGFSSFQFGVAFGGISGLIIVTGR